MNHCDTAARSLVAIAFALALIGSSTNARADGEEGTVLKIDGNDIYIDLGAQNGVGAGSTLTLMHVIVAKNPVTNQNLRDRFPLGQLRVIKAGSHLCIAHAPAELLKRVRAGDEVTLASAPRKFEDPWEAEIEEREFAREARKKARKEATLPADPEKRIAQLKAEYAFKKARAQFTIDQAEAARKVWRETLGKAPQDRIAMWKAYLNGNENSPYAEAVRKEIGSLQAQMTAESKVSEQLTEPDSRRADLRVERLASLDATLDLNSPLVVNAPHKVYQGEGVKLSFTVLSPPSVARAWLYYRHTGDRAYQRTNLSFDGDVYMRGQIPAEISNPPAIEFFVEVAGSGQDSPPSPVIGSQEFPRRIAVQKRVEETPPVTDDRSRVTLFTDYVDFDGRFGGGFDQYIHAEVDFMYRFIKPIYAVRVGFGTLGGIGGPKDFIDRFPDTCMDENGDYRCRRVTYTYAYAEFEYRVKNWPVSVMLRPQIGSGTRDFQANTTSDRCATDDVSDCEIFRSIGVRARLRIGEERKTNLTLGVGLTEKIGNLFEAAFSWDVIPKFPIKISAEVTDQPVPEDFGVRLIGDIGWRKFSWIYPSLRISYQARDVDHAGLSGGGAINFDW